MKALYSTATGLVVRTVPLGEINLPLDIRVDEQAGRAIIATSPQGSVRICRLFVLDMASGTVLGSVPIGTSPLAVALDERTGHVFVASGNTGRGRVYMVDVRTGALLRTITVGIFPDSLAVDERAARLFVVNDNQNSFFASSASVLDTQNGRLLRTVSVGRLPSAPLVDAQAGRVLVANTASNSISVLDARDGRVLHTITLAAPVIGPGNVPVSIALDEQTGRTFALREHRLLVIDTAAGRVLRTIQSSSDSMLAVAERAGRVLIASPHTNTVSVLDAASGRLLHAVHLAAPSWITIDERSGYALVTASRATSLLDPRSGRVRYTIPLDPHASVTPDTPEGRLFAVNSYSVGVLDARTGRRLRTLTFGLKPSLPFPDQMFAPLSVAVDEPARLAFIVDFIHQRVSSVDPHSGTILRSATVPSWPGWTLIDERTGQALLLSLGGETESVPDAWGWVPGWLRRHLPFLPSPGALTRVAPGSVSVLDVRR